MDYKTMMYFKHSIFRKEYIMYQIINVGLTPFFYDGHIFILNIKICITVLF